MTMFAAIALSAGNKAQAYSERPSSAPLTIIVQERYAGPDARWYHVWDTDSKGTAESDIPYGLTLEIQKIYAVDPTADYWQPV